MCNVVLEKGDKMVGNNTNTITLSTLAVIYLSAFACVLLQYFSNADFGLIGFVSWIIVIIGAIGFIVSFLGEL